MFEAIVAMFSSVAGFDAWAMQATESVRWGPVTAALTVVSLWWVKGPLIAGVGACADVRAAVRGLRPSTLLPSAAGCAAVAFFVASGLNHGLKELFERDRPPLTDASVSSAVELPASFSFPSGHAMTAFAAAVAVAVVRPKLRVPMLVLASLVAVSRPYLGVHFWTDVLIGSALGALVGYGTARGVGWAAERLSPEPQPSLR